MSLDSRRESPRLGLAVLMAGLVLSASTAVAHPMGNFSISHYSGIRIVHGHANDHHQLGHALHDHHGHDHAASNVSLKQLFILGVTGGIVPCPAALVVLLSALSLGRVRFGLMLIVAFSLGLAVVLIATGILVVYARRLMARVRGEGVLITRWLPLTSSTVIIVLGLGIAAQALQAAGILQIRL